MENMNEALSSANRKTAVLATNQFQCERLIKAGRTVAGITHTDLVVLSVQSNEYDPNPEAMQHLFNISSENNAVMNVLYSEDTFKTIVDYLKHNNISNVITGIPQADHSVLHRIWKKFKRIKFFMVDEEGKMEEVMDKSYYKGKAEPNISAPLQSC